MRAVTRLRRLLGLSASRECVRVGELLQSYLDGEVDDPTAQQIAAHLERCRGCGLEADTYRRLKAVLGTEGRPDPGALDRLRAFADELASSPGPHRPGSGPPWSHGTCPP